MTYRAHSFQAPFANLRCITQRLENFMSIRNAIIAMRKRKIGLFEQERVALLDDERPSRRVRGEDRTKTPEERRWRKTVPSPAK